MKINFLAVLFTCVLSFNAFSQEQQNARPTLPHQTLQELVLGISNLKPAQASEIKKGMAVLPGVIWEGYCQDEKLILLRVNRSVQPDDINITNKILEVNPDFKIYFKERSFQDVLNSCVDKEKVLNK